MLRQTVGKKLLNEHIREVVGLWLLRANCLHVQLEVIYTVY